MLFGINQLNTRASTSMDRYLLVRISAFVAITRLNLQQYSTFYEFHFDWGRVPRCFYSSCLL